MKLLINQVGFTMKIAPYVYSKITSLTLAVVELNLNTALKNLIYPFQKKLQLISVLQLEVLLIVYFNMA